APSPECVLVHLRDVARNRAEVQVVTRQRRTFSIGGEDGEVAINHPVTVDVGPAAAGSWRKGADDPVGWVVSGVGETVGRRSKVAAAAELDCRLPGAEHVVRQA